jgi:hypothetical protein
MGFWDWLIGEPEQISGTPHATRRDIYKGQKKPYSGGMGIGDVGKFVSDAWNTRNPQGNYRLTGGSLQRTRAVPELPWMNSQADSGPTTADILAQLQALQDPSRYMSDEGSLVRQARAMAAAQYDPAIAQLESQMGSARSRASRNQAELGKMFSALSTDLQGDIPEIQQMYAQDKADSQQTYDQLQQQITNQYNTSATEQEDMMKRLNIQAAAPDILPQQQRDRDYFTTLAARDAGIEQQALGQEERGAVNYTQQGSQIARSEGTQRQADVMAQLSDLLANYESQIGAQRIAKNQSYLGSLAELENNQKSSAADAAQRDFQNYIAMIQLGRDLRKDETGGKVTSVKSPADVAGRALGMGLPQRSAQTVQDTFMSAISSDPQILSGTSVFGTSVPKEAMAQRVVEAGRKQGLSRAELNALQTIALEYFGRR